MADSALDRVQDGSFPDVSAVDEVGLNSGRAADGGPEVGRKPLAFVNVDARPSHFQATDRLDHFLALKKAHDNFVHGKTLVGEGPAKGVITL
jgi:hypothetical protein